MRKLQWVGVILGSSGLAFLVLLGIVNIKQAAVSALPLTEPAQFAMRRVGVLGDAQKGLANLSRITSAVMKEEVLFILQTGDLVSNNDEGHYRLARHYHQLGGGDRVPLVVAPGNHDIKGGSERFKAWFGDLEKSFTMIGVAFVLLDNALGAPPVPKHVEDLIAAAGPHKAVVLAMHQPPFDIQGNPRPEYAEFLAWLEKSKVAYLLCGHVHTYMKKRVGETTVIINGVGGDSDSWQFGQKVYATILEINGSRISDRTIELEPVHEVWENVEHLAIGHVAEAYRRKPVLCWLGTLLLAGAVGWGWRRLLRRPKIPQAA